VPNRSAGWTPLLIATAIIRGVIIAVGIALLAVGPSETIRLLGVLAIVFGGIRLWMLFRYRRNNGETHDRNR